MLLEGLHIPVTTPFHHDGRLNTHKLAANVVRYSRTPAAGLIILSPTGEPTLLSDTETRDALRTAAEAAAPEKVLIAGIARDSVAGVLELAKFAVGLQYDVILVGIPWFLAPESMFSRLDAQHQPLPLAKRQLLELRTFFETVADHSPLPVVLLNVPGRTIPLSIARRVSTHPNIIGLCGTGRSKEVQTTVIHALLEYTAGKMREVTVTHVFAAVTGRMQKASSNSSRTLVSLTAIGSTAVAEHTDPAIRTRKKTVGFQILAGNTKTTLDGLNDGAIGIAPAFAACAPQACYEIFAAWKDQNQPLASEKQQRIVEAARRVESLGPAALKFAADLNGYFGGPTRLPHLPLTAEQCNAIEQLMKPIRN